MDQWLLAVTSDPAAKGSAKDLEVAGAGPVHCHFSIPPSFLTMCSSERCLSFTIVSIHANCCSALSLTGLEHDSIAYIKKFANIA